MASRSGVYFDFPRLAYDPRGLGLPEIDAIVDDAIDSSFGKTPSTSKDKH
jgi:hypothetical protein